MPTTWNALYLGNVATPMDPLEGNENAENAGSSSYIGRTFGGTGNPLYENIHSVEAVNRFGPNDSNGQPVLNQDNRNGTDQIRVDLDGNGTPETYDFDAVASYNATITFHDGSTRSVAVNLFQTTTGQVFLAPSQSAATNAVLSSAAITSIKLNSLVASGSVSAGLLTNRPQVDFVCFAAGTLIRTPEGEVAVETLAPGALVLTADQGAQPVRWVGRAEIDLSQSPHLRPVRIARGALGDGLPRADLTVSPQHRVLVRSKIAQRMFGAAEVLVAAKQLLTLEGIALAEDLDRVTYVHFLFDRHQLVWSNGAPTESLFTGPQALDSVGPAARAEIMALFPELMAETDPVPARPLVPGAPGRRMADRHARNGMALLG